MSQSFGREKSIRNGENDRARIFETFLRHGREEKHTGNRQNTHFIPRQEKRARNSKSYCPHVQLSGKMNAVRFSPQRVFGDKIQAQKWESVSDRKIGFCSQFLKTFSPSPS